MKVKKVINSDGAFKDEKRKNIKRFLKMCKYDVAPAFFIGAVASEALTIDLSRSDLDIILFGGVIGVSLTLAINGIITGIRMTIDQKNKIKEEIEKNNNGDVNERIR